VRLVVALGGNALLRRGQAMTTEAQRANVSQACDSLVPLAAKHELVISHGNGPQIGVLALEAAAYEELPPSPLDVLGAETQGMIGYMVEQELANRLPEHRLPVTVLTMVEVDGRDPALADPTKPIGPLYGDEEAAKLASERGWVFKRDGSSMRRVVPSPAPGRILEEPAIKSLLAGGSVVICAGGGGIPVKRGHFGALVGVEAVIDKDLTSALLARSIGADMLIMATDAPAAFVGFGTPQQRAIARAHPDALLNGLRSEFASGSMLPKIVAACEFVRATGKPAAIGALADISEMVEGGAGTIISMDALETTFADGETSTHKEVPR
jgi:carbamate kinase